MKRRKTKTPVLILATLFFAVFFLWSCGTNLCAGYSVFMERSVIAMIKKEFPVYAHVVKAENEESKYRAESISTEVLWQPQNVFGENKSGIELIRGESYLEEKKMEEENQKMIAVLNQSGDYEYLIRNFYVVDSSTNVTETIFPVEKLIEKDMTIERDVEKPQILIHHSHASEAFADSREGKLEDSVVGVGMELARILSEDYGYQVLHDKTIYDMKSGNLDRNKAYNYAAEGTWSVLERYPSIEVILDIHRDSGEKRVTTIKGEQTAQIMFFNGLSRNTNGNIEYLHNPYLEDNLAFSLQLKLEAMKLYPDYTKKIYLKSYLYNLNMMPKSALIEVGTEQNKVQEAKRAMYPLAEVLHHVLSGEVSE